MKIRSVNEPDILPIIKLITDVWAEYDCPLEIGDEEKHLLAPGDYFRARNGEFWVVENNNEIIGTVAVMFVNAETAELKSLYVRRDYRRKGLGADLTELVIKFARAKDAKEIILWSDTRFTKAHRLYEKLGFEKVGERELNDLNNSKEVGFKLKLISKPPI